MNFRTWCKHYFPGGTFSQDGIHYSCRNHYRDDKKPSLSFSDLDGGKWFDHGTGEGGAVKFFCRDHGIPEVWDGADPWEENPREGERTGGADIQPLPEREEPGQGDKLAAIRATWERAGPVRADHTYLARKGIPAGDLRQRGSELLIPAYNVAGDLVGFERIADSGQKKHEGQKAGAFSPCGLTEYRGTVHVCEGYATAASLREITGLPSVSSFGAAGLVKVALALREKGAEPVVCPDCDRAGREAARAARKEGLTVVELPPEHEGKDWNDLALEQGIDRAREIFEAAREPGLEPEPSERSRRFRLQRVGDIPLTEPDFLVDGLFESDILALFFGESGAKKSFVAFDLAASIATGAPFHDRPVKEGAVIYIAGEGQGGMARRAKAWEKHRGISLSNAPLFLSSRAGLFMDENSALEVEAEVARVAEEAGDPLLIIVDTVARAMAGGDENSAKDTSYFVERVDALRRQYGAAALLVHHSGLNDKGRLRGSSAWRGALDAEFLLEANGADGEIVTVTCKKMKDAAIPSPFSFEALEYTVLEGKKGPVTSLALEPTEKRPAREERMTPSQQMAMETYHAAAMSAPTLDGEGRFMGVHLDDWQPVFFAASTASTYGGKWRAFDRARKELAAKGKLNVENDIYTVVESTDTIQFNDYAKKLKALSDIDKSTNIDNVDNCRFANPVGISTDIDTPLKGCRCVDTGLSIEVEGEEKKHPSPGGDPREEIPAAGPTGEEGILPPGGVLNEEIPSPAPQGNKEEKTDLAAAEEWAEKFPRLKYQLKAYTIKETRTPEEARELYEVLLLEAFREDGGAVASLGEPAAVDLPSGGDLKGGDPERAEDLSPGGDLEVASPGPEGEDLSEGGDLRSEALEPETASPWPKPEDLQGEDPAEESPPPRGGPEPEGLPPGPTGERVPLEGLPQAPLNVAAIASLAGADIEAVKEELARWEGCGRLRVDVGGGIIILEGGAVPDEEHPGPGEHLAPSPEGAAGQDELAGSDPAPQGRLFGAEDGGPGKTPTGQGDPRSRPRGKGRPRDPGGQGRLDLEEGPAPGQSETSFNLFGRVEPGELPEDLRNGAGQPGGGGDPG